jgi:hypothetical protein
MYETGHGAAKDPAKATDLYTKACNRAWPDVEPEACDKVNPARARTLRTRICEQGDPGFIPAPGLDAASVSAIRESGTSVQALACEAIGRDQRSCDLGPWLATTSTSCDKLCRKGDKRACARGSPALQSEMEAAQEARDETERARRRAALGDPGSAADVVQDLATSTDPIAKASEFAKALAADAQVTDAAKRSTLTRIRNTLPRMRAMFCSQQRQEPRTYAPAQWTAAVTIRCEDNPPEQYYPNVYPNPNPPLNTVAACKAAYATPCR